MTKLLLVAFLGSLLLAQVLPEQRGKDGKYHDPATGAVQPESCNSDPSSKSPCDCERANANCKDGAAMHPGSKCKTWCRPDDCACGSCS